MQEKPKPFVMRIFAAFLKRFFYLLYHQHAWAYDWVAWVVSLGRWKAWVSSVVPHLNGPKVLELGHGPGHLQAALVSSEVWSCGLDESLWMSALAAKKCSRLVNGCAQALPFMDKAFSQVVATFPAEFILEERTLSEVFRVLRPGGEFVLLPIAWINWLFRATGESPEKNLDLISRQFATPLEKAHFQVEISTMEICNSELLLVVARKLETDIDLPSPQGG